MSLLQKAEAALSSTIRRVQKERRDQERAYLAWLESRAPFSPLVDLSGEGKVKKDR